MKLSELFVGNKSAADSASRALNTAAYQNMQISRQIRSLIPGQTILGELVARNGNEVQIKLSEDFVLKARLEQNMNLEVGKSITFEVKNNGSSLILNPLFTNVSTDVNVLKALEMAALPVTEQSVKMTEQMMKSGLSIDKASLQQVYRESNQFPQTDITDIVDLHKLSLPVTEENLTQLSSYKNLTHQLITGINNCIEAIPDTIQQMIQLNDVAGAKKLYQELTHLIQENSFVDTQGEAVIESEVNSPILVQTTDRQILVLNVETENGRQLFHFPGDSQLLQNLIAPETREQVLSLLNAETLSLVSAEKMQNGDPDIEVLLHGIKNGEKNIHLTPLKEFISNNLQKLWTIEPEEVADAKQVDKLYDRLDRQLRSLSQTLESVHQTNSDSYKAVSNLTQNLDFLHQINQVYSFIQLPLRLQQGNNAHGELYVYTNKKHLAAKDGEISALLHLDMEHLGPIDVYVAMQYEKVQTKFYICDEDMLTFLEEHMDILTERLNSRGYSCNCEMQIRDVEEEKTGAIHQMLHEDGQIPVVQYAFDVRT